jgi:hypothetical protein
MEMTTRRVICIVLVMLLATPFLTADAAEMTSMEVGVKDVSVAGPPSKCEGSSKVDKLYGCAVLPMSRAGADDAAEASQRELLSETALLTYIWAHITKNHPQGFWTIAVYIEMISAINENDAKVSCDTESRSGPLFAELTKSQELADAAKKHFMVLLSYECDMLDGAAGELNPDLDAVSKAANSQTARGGSSPYVCMTPSDVDDLWVKITEKLTWEGPGDCVGERKAPQDKTGDHTNCPGVLVNQWGADLELRMDGDIRSCPADLRRSERFDETIYVRDGVYVRVLFDTRAEGRIGAKLSLLRTSL